MRKGLHFASGYIAGFGAAGIIIASAAGAPRAAIDHDIPLVIAWAIIYFVTGPEKA